MTDNYTLDAEGEQIKLGDVVQVNPDANLAFGGCFITVAELLGFGVRGFASVPSPNGSKPYHFRVESKNFRRIGRAVFRILEKP